MGRRTLSTVGSVVAVVVVVVLVALGRSGGEGAAPTSDPSSSRSQADHLPGTDGPTAEPSDVDPESGLPREGRRTLALIDAGGPFPYPGKDGSTFGNFERLLPQRPRGYYAEYTVPTPGSRDRGARRIITGDGGEYYWTADHYEHFDRIKRSVGQAARREGEQAMVRRNDR
jgi:ribonuclease T1